MEHRPFFPEIVYLTADAAGDPITRRVLSRLPNAEVIELDSVDDPLAADTTADDKRFTQGKRRLMLTRHRGNWLEHCPASAGNQVCCNLWTINFGEGCPLDCTYCYLQSYLRRNPTLKLFTNVADGLEELRVSSQQHPERLFRVGTGEVIDSLVWEELTDLSTELVPFFGRSSNLLLEFKSKYDAVDNLVAMKDEHRGRTVVSWSVNADSITQRDEAMTAPLERRLAAAARCVDAGYRVGFHFDPLVYFEGFEDAYAEIVARIFKVVSPRDVAWTSIGTLRFRRDMKSMMRSRFPESTLPYAEMFLGDDHKLHYSQPIRFRLMRHVWNQLRSVSSTMPVYMCMETAAAWRNIAGGVPAEDSNLVEIMSRNVVQRGDHGSAGEISGN